MTVISQTHVGRHVNYMFNSFAVKANVTGAWGYARKSYAATRLQHGSAAALRTLLAKGHGPSCL